MRKITYVLTTALLLAGSSATSIGATIPDKKDAALNIRPIARVVTRSTPPADLEPIMEAPEGTRHLYGRDCDGFDVEGYEASHSDILGSIVDVITTDSDVVWLSYMASEYPADAWVKATVHGDTLTIEGPQAIAYGYNEWTEQEVTVYLVPLTLKVDENQVGTYVESEDLRYDFKITPEGKFVSLDPTMLLGVCTYGESGFEGQEAKYGYVWAGYGDRDITIYPVTDQPVTPPSDLRYEQWAWQDQYERSRVNVAIDGNDFYISGMNRNLPDAWIKGQIRGDKVVFPSGQYLGPDYAIHYLSYFIGAEVSYAFDPSAGKEVRRASYADEAIFSYDRENNSLTLDNGYAINSTASRLYPLYIYDGVEMHLQVRDDNDPPAAPYNVVFIEDPWGSSVWFQVPDTDVEGVIIDTDRLYYEIIMDGEPIRFTTSVYTDFPEDMTRIPYDFSDWNDVWVEGTDHTVYLYTMPEKYLGVRSVYINASGEELYSAIGYAEGYSGIGSVDADRKVSSVEWYDMTGRRMTRPTNTIAIRVTTYDNGDVERTKVAVK